MKRALKHHHCFLSFSEILLSREPKPTQIQQDGQGEAEPSQGRRRKETGRSTYWKCRPVHRVTPPNERVDAPAHALAPNNISGGIFK